MHPTLSDILALVALILAAYNVFLGVKYVPRRMRVRRFIRMARDEIDASLEGGKTPTENARRAHAVVKALHADVYVRVGRYATCEVVDTLRKALGAARIYYWVRQLDSEDREVVRDLMNEQYLLWTHKRVRQSSLEFVLNYVRDIEDVESTRRKIDLKYLEMQCRAEHAGLRKLEIYLAAYLT